MNFETLMELVTQTGILCATAYLLGKTLLDLLKKDKEQAREDYKADKERLYTFIENQNGLLQELKELANKQATTSEHSKEMLNKLTDIQMLHTNRLDRIEERLARLEDKRKRE